MAAKVVCAIFVLFPAVVFCADRGSSCTTPNGEVAKCSTFNTCSVIRDAVATFSKDAIDFAKASQCGWDNEPLVCCGSVGYPSRNVATISPLLPNRTSCGLQKGNRVYGGEMTEIWEHPWMALLKYKNLDGSDAGFKCGGTIINNRYILTAAHCVAINPNQGYDLDSVRLGEWRISTDEDCEEDVVNDECADPVVNVGIEKRIVNKEYNRRSGKHDIALLRLERNIAFSDYIRPICMPQPQAPAPEPGTKLTVVGWGATENSSASDNKLKVEVPIVSRSDCSAKISQRGSITEQQLCAGGVSGKDSCQGDSGGPLMGKYSTGQDGDQQWYQEGVVSWGVGCGFAGYPAIYTKVSMYMQWIVDSLQPF